MFQRQVTCGAVEPASQCFGLENRPRLEGQHEEGRLGEILRRSRVAEQSAAGTELNGLGNSTEQSGQVFLAQFANEIAADDESVLVPVGSHDAGEGRQDVFLAVGQIDAQ